MRKKIAIVGCSHSAERYDKSGARSWSWLLKDLCHVDNYAQPGHGVLEYDTALKHIVAEKKSYDALIIQYTGVHRWHYPIAGPSYHRFVEKKHDDNYSDWYSDVSKKVLTGNLQPLKNVERPHIHGNYISEEKKSNYYNNDTGMSQASYYLELFRQTLFDFYQPYFKKIFYFSTTSNFDDHNNLGHDNLAFEFILNSGHPIEDLIDDTNHLTSLGNSVLYNEYLLKSPLGNYIKG